MVLFHPISLRPEPRVDGASVYIILTDGFYVATARYCPWNDKVGRVLGNSRVVVQYVPWEALNATHWCYVYDLVSLI